MINQTVQLVTRQQIIDTARLALGTPYAEQGRIWFERGLRKGAGLDCCGLLLFVGQALKVTTLEVLGYSNEPMPDDPPDRNFRSLLEKHCRRLPHWSQAQRGDIFAHDFGRGIQHASIVVGREGRHWKCIHAVRQHGTHEAYLSFEMNRAIVAAYQIPGICTRADCDNARV